MQNAAIKMSDKMTGSPTLASMKQPNISAPHHDIVRKNPVCPSYCFLQTTLMTMQERLRLIRDMWNMSSYSGLRDRKSTRLNSSHQD